MPLIQRFAGRVPILGRLPRSSGDRRGVRRRVIVRAPTLMHGKTSLIHHDGAGVFAGLPNPFTATRYHSLIVERSSAAADALEITAETDDGMIMGLRHREFEVEGVQFHPESILTPVGKDLLANFLGLREPVPASCARARAASATERSGGRRRWRSDRVRHRSRDPARSSRAGR